MFDFNLDIENKNPLFNQQNILNVAADFMVGKSLDNQGE